MNLPYIDCLLADVEGLYIGNYIKKKKKESCNQPVHIYLWKNRLLTIIVL
jgi:hypothetical protein